MTKHPARCCKLALPVLPVPDATALAAPQDRGHIAAAFDNDADVHDDDTLSVPQVPPLAPPQSTTTSSKSATAHHRLRHCMDRVNRMDRALVASRRRATPDNNVAITNSPPESPAGATVFKPLPRPSLPNSRKSRLGRPRDRIKDLSLRLDDCVLKVTAIEDAFAIPSATQDRLCVVSQQMLRGLSTTVSTQQRQIQDLQRQIDDLSSRLSHLPTSSPIVASPASPPAPLDQNHPPSVPSVVAFSSPPASSHSSVATGPPSSLPRPTSQPQPQEASALDRMATVMEDFRLAFLDYKKNSDDYFEHLKQNSLEYHERLDSLGVTE